MDEAGQEQARCEAAARRAHLEFVSRFRAAEVFQDYRHAFEASIGLPLVLRAPNSYARPLEGSRRMSPFCALMARRSATCAACLTAQAQVEAAAAERPATTKCFAGLNESAVPILMDGVLVGFLQTGQVLFGPLSRAELAGAVEMARGLDRGLGRAQARAALQATRVISAEQYDSVLRLLGIFAQQLAAISKALLMRGALREPPAVARARNFIAEHFGEELSLSTVAQVAGMSRYYFCKTFRQSTGFTYTDYLSRVRVEAVKNGLREPGRHIGEAAFAAGFRSLSQFNRVFHRVVGERPSAFRDRVCSTAPKAQSFSRGHAA